MVFLNTLTVMSQVPTSAQVCRFQEDKCWAKHMGQTEMLFRTCWGIEEEPDENTLRT